MTSLKEIMDTVAKENGWKDWDELYNWHIDNRIPGEILDYFQDAIKISWQRAAEEQMEACYQEAIHSPGKAFDAVAIQETPLVTLTD